MKKIRKVFDFIKLEPKFKGFRLSNEILKYRRNELRIIGKTNKRQLLTK